MEAIDLSNPIHRLSVERFHRLIEADVLDEGDRVELIDGEIRDMPPIGPPHGGCTNSLTMIFTPPLAGRAIVSVQGPLTLDDGTEVYPDFMVLRWRDDRYARANPTPEDVRLLVEVADSSLALDRGLKLGKYARAGIGRYWVADIQHRTLHDYRDPDRFGGRYRQLHSVSEGRISVTIEEAEIQVEIAELFPG